MSDEYKQTDYVHAIDSRDAVRYEAPGVTAIVEAWVGKEGSRVRVNQWESGVVSVVRTRDQTLLVELDGGGRYIYPMRTTELEEG